MKILVSFSIVKMVVIVKFYSIFLLALSLKNIPYLLFWLCHKVINETSSMKIFVKVSNAAVNCVNMCEGILYAIVILNKFVIFLVTFQ